MLPIKGFEGSLTVNGTAINWITTWEVELEKDEQTVGPFIGTNGETYTFYNGQRLVGSLEGVVPEGKDAGQMALISGAIASSNVNLQLVVTSGIIVSIPSGLVTNFTISPEADGSVNFTADFVSNGVFTIT
jgi:hypothetical protein